MTADEIKAAAAELDNRIRQIAVLRPLSEERERVIAEVLTYVHDVALGDALGVIAKEMNTQRFRMNWKGRLGAAALLIRAMTVKP